MHYQGIGVLGLTTGDDATDVLEDSNVFISTLSL